MRTEEGPESEFIFAAEINAIERRRHRIKNLSDGQPNANRRDRTDSKLTGIALSGGGIRSASIALGTLQALHVCAGIEGIDYLSTVSGGGYTGCSMTASMQNTNGAFPFTQVDSFDDTDSVRHIRDFSNYLIPHGALDVITAVSIFARGIVANIILLAPFLLFLVWLTLTIHPTWESLGRPKFLIWDLATWLSTLGLQGTAPLWGLSGFWFTAAFLGINFIFLAVWAFAKSISISYFWQSSFATRRAPGDSAELNGIFPHVAQALFLLIVISAWFEAQPLILSQMPPSSTNDRLWGFAHLCDWLINKTPYLAPIGAIFAFMSKYLGDTKHLAKRSIGWQAWLKWMSATAALWFAALIIPSFLWGVYLSMTYIGLGGMKASDPTFMLDKLRSAMSTTPTFVQWLANALPWVGSTVATRLYFEAFIVTLLLALFVNPNATSLYRLYRDRLSKAFLFNPNCRDRRQDLQAVDLKLHAINTDLCPYPIINAALNIEGSQFANKRGRNADFFIFTPKYTGSDATGYVQSSLIEDEEPALDLGTAMAISAAAVSPNMGAATIKPLVPTLALLNVRLGYWLRNPYVIRRRRSWLAHLRDIRGFLLFKEIFSWITEKSRTIYLTDGGNIENLGIYALLKRRCAVIIAIDAEADPTMSFGSLLTLQRYARIDLGVIIDLPWQEIRENALKFDTMSANSDDNSATFSRTSGPHCAAGRITYGPNESGILLYLKSSLNGDEPDYVLDYKHHHSAFPHETTSDQFFKEEQLEAYRALGFHMMEGALSGAVPFAVKPGVNETRPEACERILQSILGALRGAPANEAKIAASTAAVLTTCQVNRQAKGL